MGSYIRSIGIANPGKPIPQNEIASFMVKAHGLTGAEQQKLEALFRSTGISNRYSVISDYAENGVRNFFPTSDDLEPFPSTKVRMELFRDKAIELSLAAVEDSLGKDFDLKTITHLITVSCTGMYAPGLDVDLINRMNLPSFTNRTAINYMGCYAALNALKLADSICNSDSKAKVLIVSVELCSIHFQKQNTDDNYLANSIFGDGAAAVLVSSETNTHGLRLNAFYSDILQNGNSDMAWTIDDFGFQMKLSAYVPDVIKFGIKQLLDRFLNRVNLHPEDIDYYAIHPGGKRILDEIENELSLDRGKNIHAREVLKNYGNMSSPTILFVLKSLWGKLTEEDRGKLVLAMAFGPGLTIEFSLLEIK